MARPAAVRVHRWPDQHCLSCLWLSQLAFVFSTWRRQTVWCIHWQPHPSFASGSFWTRTSGPGKQQSTPSMLSKPSIQNPDWLFCFVRYANWYSLSLWQSKSKYLNANGTPVPARSHGCSVNLPLPLQNQSDYFGYLVNLFSGFASKNALLLHLVSLFFALQSDPKEGTNAGAFITKFHTVLQGGSILGKHSNIRGARW